MCLKVRGKVFSVMNGFGYIFSEGGERYFFHKSHVIDEIPFKLIEPGMEVIFMPVTENPKGPYATQIEFI